MVFSVHVLYVSFIYFYGSENVKLSCKLDYNSVDFRSGHYILRMPFLTLKMMLFFLL